MSLEANIALAEQAWEACHIALDADLASEVRLKPAKARPYKMGRATAHICVQPRRKVPAGFWEGWTWYELIVGHVQNPHASGLTSGTLRFIHSFNQKGSGGGAYLRPVHEILKQAAASLGSPYFVPPPGEKSIELTRVFKEAAFSTQDAGGELARLIAATLPKIQTLRDAR
jgi:hypothetical protein